MRIGEPLLSVLALATFALTVALVAPASSRLSSTAWFLLDTARKVDPDRFARELERANPFRHMSFEPWRLGRLLRADLRPFGSRCLELQRQCRRWNRRMLLGMLPLVGLIVVMAASAR
jgi:hypothetical protein